MMTAKKNSLWMDNQVNNNFAAFSLAEMNRMATWKH